MNAWGKWVLTRRMNSVETVYETIPLHYLLKPIYIGSVIGDQVVGVNVFRPVA